ncbi:uncharacterized protein NECHADRAFT_122668 [Fusarium vanettenii 77-13-4]|uniref:Uncharacterized protein n=1 Tax=Fusarium vanettenii (strain ATCC MYA-4622 / CBS 123669 / FGSC 9596 / NRRL 45880 / 77-13-4) TaxID=660122 RepID=C7ZAG7_FUSV7|nr:uncharacterized protein NECHADRAFT_122668 [Fusarium vanettenii 77-13-4]EEU39272.1 hypothetical protein NECHADRAFT_122668 [Fusarium vanettenii 77-13-4]
MVNFITFAIASAILFPTLATAAACTDGLTYCGYNLLRRGDYKAEIIAELERVGDHLNDPTEEYDIYHGLFKCGEGGHGWIRYVSHCDRFCNDGGAGKDDYC